MSEKESPVCYMMIGLPYSGKSTYVNNIIKKEVGNIAVMSTDDIIHGICKDKKIDYNEGVKVYFKVANAIMNTRIDAQLKSKKNFVLDRTNLTKKGRERNIRRFHDAGYKVIGVVFPTPSQAQIEKFRKNRPEQVISDGIIEDMKKRFDKPTESEGFDELRKV